MNQLRQQVRADRQTGADFNHPDLIRTMHDLLHLVHQRNEMPRITEQPRSFIGQVKALGKTVKQLDAIIFFQFRDGLTDRWLRNVQTLGGSGHAESIGYLDKYFQVAKGHLDSTPLPHI